MSNVARKAKKLLSGEEKYDLWLRMLTGQITTAQAATESGVDRTTIMTVRRVGACQLSCVRRVPAVCI